MIVDIVVPQVGEAVAEVTIVRWLKSEGDSIDKGEVLFEVDTDKSVIEVEAFQSGVLRDILAREGESVMPQEVVARLEVDGTSSRETSVPLTQSRDGGTAGRGDRAQAHSSGSSSAPLRRSSESKVRATPKARAAASSMNVDLETIEGTGVGGLITAEDVHRAHAGNHRNDRERAHTSRKAVAEAMVRSKREAPHFYLQSDVDMTEAARLRTHCVDRLGWQKPPSYTDIIVRAAAIALRQLPEVNIRYSEGSVVQRATVDIGIAVAGDHGLQVGVLRNAAEKPLKQVSAGVSELVLRAREGRLRSGDIGDKSLVISNLGMFGIDVFYAIIDVPDPMIVAVGKIGDKVVAVDGQPRVRPTCTVSLSADHRALDGADAARFLVCLKEIIENAMNLADD